MDEPHVQTAVITPTIKQLSEDVVNKIAAGEVIQRPKNVVKELLENSLDAGSTTISVVVDMTATDMKLIQIKDNGCGIKKEDMVLACERFCTSKLESVEDLTKMTTFGFRGEALASISHVAHVEITTRTKDSPIGFVMKYEEGKPESSEPRPIGSPAGTVIKVSDLFYNLDQRRNSLRSTRDEYSMILEVVSLYSLNNIGVSFALMKLGKDPDVKINCEHDLMMRIKIIFGIKAAENLVPIDVENNQPEQTWSVKAMVGDINSCLKSYKYIFFVNNRLVDCNPLKKSLEVIYKSKLTRGSCALVFISLKVPPSTLDVNIHPTKSEVRFLYESEIIRVITEKVSEILSVDVVSSRVSHGHSSSKQNDSMLNTSISSVNLNSSRNGMSQSLAPQHQIRGDNSAQTLDDMMKRQEIISQDSVTTDWRPIKLTSVKNLKSSVVSQTDLQLKKLLRSSGYIGVTKSKSPLMFIQVETTLLSVKLESVSQEIFYQLYLKYFGNFSSLILQPPLSLAQLLQVHISRTDTNERMTQLEAKNASDIIVDRKELLLDYFSITIDESGSLCSLPILLEGYYPDEARLPAFVSDLVSTVDWKNEEQCFLSLGRAIARLFAVTDHTIADEQVVSSLIFPLIKQKLRPPSSLSDSIVKVTDTASLYRVFHRC